MDTKTIVKRVIGWVIILLIPPALCMAFGPVHRVDGGKEGLALANFLVGVGIDLFYLGIYGLWSLLEWLFD